MNGSSNNNNNHQKNKKNKKKQGKQKKKTQDNHVVDALGDKSEQDLRETEVNVAHDNAPNDTGDQEDGDGDENAEQQSEHAMISNGNSNYPDLIDGQVDSEVVGTSGEGQSPSVESHQKVEELPMNEHDEEESGKKVEANEECGDNVAFIVNKSLGSSSTMDSIQKSNARRNMSVDESFVDAMDYLAESRAASTEESRILSERNGPLIEDEREESEVSSKLNLDEVQAGRDSEEVLEILKQKVTDLEDERTLVISKFRELEKSAGLELVGEFHQSDHRLVDLVDRFIDGIICREDESSQALENAKSELEVCRNENQNLVDQSEGQISQLKRELAETKLLLDETRRSKEEIVAVFEQYKVNICSSMAEAHQFENEVATSRNQIVQLESQMTQLKEELHESNDKKDEALCEIERFKILVEKQEEERSKLLEDLQKLRTEVDDKGEHYKHLEEKCIVMEGENARLLAELQDSKKKFLSIEANLVEANACSEEMDGKCTDLAAQLVEAEKERDSLHSAVEGLQSSLSEMENSMAVLSQSHSDLKSLFDSMTEKFIASIEGLLNKEDLSVDAALGRLHYLECIFGLLIDKSKDAISQVEEIHKILSDVGSEYEDFVRNLPEMSLHAVLTQVFSRKKMQIKDLNEKLEILESARSSEKEEARVLKEQMSKYEEDCRKVKEDGEILRRDLEQMENRYSSTREKLRIAISKGKKLEQSLESKAKELEECSKELQIKTKELNEIESRHAEHAKNLELDLVESQRAASIFQESISEKDSLLQKLAGILQGADLTEDLYPEDLVEIAMRLLEDLEKAQNNCNWLKEELDNCQRTSGTLSSEVEELKTTLSSLDEKLLQENQGKEALLKTVQELNSQLHSLSEEAIKNASQRSVPEDLFRRLQNSMGENLEGQVASDSASYCNMENIEECLTKLVDRLDTVIKELAMLKDDCNSKNVEICHLQDALNTSNEALMELRQKDEEYHSVETSHKSEIEALREQKENFIKERDEIKRQADLLQSQLDDSKEKEAILREKLAMAVKKGKGIVQQRDVLKQSIEEKEAEIKDIKEQLNIRNSLINDYEHRITLMSTELEEIENLRREELSLKNECSELQQKLLDSCDAVQSMIAGLDAIEFPGRDVSQDAGQKIVSLGNFIIELQENIALAQQQETNLKAEIDELRNEMNQTNRSLQDIGNVLADKERILSDLTADKQISEEKRSHELETLKGLLNSCTDELKEANLREDHHISEFQTLFTVLKRMTEKQQDLFASMAHDNNAKLKHLRSVDLSLREVFNRLKDSEDFQLPNECADAVEIPEDNGFENEAGLETDMDLPNDIHGENKEKVHLLDHLLGRLNVKLEKCTSNFELLMDRWKESCKSHDTQAHVLSELSARARNEILSMVESLKSVQLNACKLEELNEKKDIEILGFKDDMEKLTGILNFAIKEVEKINLDTYSDGVSGDENVLQTSICNFFGTEHSSRFQVSGNLDSHFPDTFIKTIEELLSHVRDTVQVATKKANDSELELKNLKTDLQSETDSRIAFESSGIRDLENKLAKAEAVANEVTKERDNDKRRNIELESYVEELNFKIKQHELETETRNAQVSSEIKDLEHKLSDAEAAADTIIKERDYHSIKVIELENHIQMLNSKIKQLEEKVYSANNMQRELQSLQNNLLTKDEVLADVESKVKKLESEISEKRKSLEDLNSSYKSVSAQLSDAARRSEESEKLSEKFITEAENLRFLLDIRDQEISSLRKELANTSDVPSLLEDINKKTHELEKLQVRLHNMVSKLGVNEIVGETNDKERASSVLDALERGVISLKSGLEASKGDLQKQGFQLHNSQRMVQELTKKVEALESLHSVNGAHINTREIENHNSLPTTAPEESEIEELGQSNLNSSSVTVTPHVRGTRKLPSEHLALTINVDKSAAELMDDDKGHLFKPLNTTGLIPVSTRTIADRVDGLCFSGGRMLMREPRARMGLIVYSILLHLWLVATIF